MKNLLEDAVAKEYEVLKPKVSGFCGCDLCRDDVLVYALNRLPPKYVATDTGEVVSAVSLGVGQPKTDISVMLMEAFNKVMADPRDGH